jgi:hypothetical protein
MCVADSYFIIGITDALAGGAQINGEAQEEPGLRSVYNAYKANDTINFITEQNLNTLGTLAVMGAGMPAGSRAYDKLEKNIKSIKPPKMPREIDVARRKLDIKVRKAVSPITDSITKTNREIDVFKRKADVTARKATSPITEPIKTVKRKVRSEELKLKYKAKKITSPITKQVTNARRSVRQTKIHMQYKARKAVSPAVTGYKNAKRSIRYAKIYAKYKAKKILTVSELNRFMADSKAELSIERVRERTCEKVKTQGELSKLNAEIQKTQSEINGKENLIKMANERGLRQKAKELVIEQMELETKVEGLKEAHEQIRADRLKTGKERVDATKERKRVEAERSRTRSKERVRSLVLEKQRLVERELSKELTREREIEKTLEKIIEREREVEKTTEKEREVEITREIEREREREREKERIREREIEILRFEFETPIPPSLKNKYRTGKITKRQLIKILKSKRIIKNKLGSFESILGSSSKSTAKKVTKKPVTVKRRRTSSK